MPGRDEEIGITVDAGITVSVALGEGKKLSYTEDRQNLAKLLNTNEEVLYRKYAHLPKRIQKAVAKLAGPNGVFYAKMLLAAKREK